VDDDEKCGSERVEFLLADFGLWVGVELMYNGDVYVLLKPWWVFEASDPRSLAEESAYAN